jgi:hypothetical protein
LSSVSRKAALGAEFGDDEAFADFGNLLGHQCAGKVA